ncbi:hypothetical protein MLD38_025633 [Melastoma candidum]|uniref:Uncharacterized protein n=2 Tax=Melastoma candidum TaxID=119954 RepID=A0ACB9NWW5_9MYRT|nr:hypothetical protein MLD38_025631 [Melastoma candidum]KAI4340832.1 hypothetical protein MLD38_025633 [Melastoma candidum]
MATMNSTGAVLVFTLFLASTGLSSAQQPSRTTNEFLRSSCSGTAYPSLCYNSLSSHASIIQTSPKLLASTALGVTLDSARSVSAMMTTLSRGKGMTPKESGAMKDCVDQLADAVDSIKRSIDEMSHVMGSNFALTMNDVQTWVSAALTDETTCSDGFSGQPLNGWDVKTQVRDRILTIAHLTSNALSLVNRYASGGIHA